MELVYQGLRIRLPLDGAVRVESFVMDAALNEHALAELEIRVKGNGKKAYFVVDSYEPPFFKDGEYVHGQIVSRKLTQLAEVAESTAIGYLNEADRKYSSGTKILDAPFNPNELKGKELIGDLYLEVPEQNAPIPDAVQKEAERLGITIRKY